MIVDAIQWLGQHQQGIFFTFLIVTPTVAILMKRGAAAAGVLAAVGAAAVILTRLPDISDFELLALKVKLDRQSKQVEVTLQQLQSLATSLAESGLEVLLMSGQVFQYITLREKFRLHDELIKNLEAIGTSSDTIIKIQNNFWIPVLCQGFLSNIEVTAKNLLPNVDVESEVKNLPKDDAKLQLPLPDALRKWATSRGLYDAKIKALLDDYQSIWNTGTVANPNEIP